MANALDPHPETARVKHALFDRMDRIQRSGFTIIVDGENAVIGILTSTDLAGQLKQRRAVHPSGGAGTSCGGLSSSRTSADGWPPCGITRNDLAHWAVDAPAEMPRLWPLQAGCSNS
ncbi:hypothetical protein ACWD4V_09170 [Streptomyces tsukubensis]